MGGGGGAWGSAFQNMSICLQKFLLIAYLETSGLKGSKRT